MMNSTMGSEFRRRFAGRYFGKYRAIVVDAKGDELRLGRIRVKCPVVLGEVTLGWAFPAPPTGGGFNTGELTIPKEGDYVWVEFEEGDPARPVWSHGPWGIKLGSSTVPRHSKGDPDVTDYSRRLYGNIPPSQFSGNYGDVKYIGSSDGSFIEIDSTQGANRVQISHLTGTRIEMTKEGSLQEIITQGVRRHVGSNSNTQIIGESVKNVGKDKKDIIGGRYISKISGDLSVTSKKRKIVASENLAYIEGADESYIGGTWKKEVMSQANLLIGGGFSLNVAQNVQITASENAEIIGMNTHGQIPGHVMPNAILMQGYNGKAVVRGTDISGRVSINELDCDGIKGTSTLQSVTADPLTWAEISKCYIELDSRSGNVDIRGGLPTSGRIMLDKRGYISLGGIPAVEGLIKGTQFSTNYVAVVNTLAALVDAISTDPGLAVAAPTLKATAGALLTPFKFVQTTANSKAYVSKRVRTV